MRIFPMHVDAGATERGVREGAVVYDGLTLLRNIDAVLSHVRSVLRCIKLYT